MSGGATPALRIHGVASRTARRAASVPLQTIAVGAK